MNLDSAFVILIQTSVVLAIALVATWLARGVPALRLAVGRVALLAVFGLVAVAPWVGVRPAPVVPVQWASSLPAAVSIPTSTVEKVTQKPSLPASAPSSKVIPPVEEQVDLSLVVIACWTACVGVLGLSLLFGYVGLAKVRRTCTVVTDVRVQEALAEACRASHIRTPKIVSGKSVGNPFVAGVLRPTIFVPESWLQSVDDQSLQAVLRHEVAHIANGDLRWGLLHRLACVVFWPQPLLWMLRGPMASASEEVCDRQVLASGVPDVRYAECLIALREGMRSRPCPSLGIGAVSRPSALAKRVEAILDTRRSRAVSLTRSVSLITRLGAVALAGIAALVFARPVAQVRDDMAGWIKEPYATNVKILGPNGIALPGARAWIVFTGDLPEAKSRPLKVTGSTVQVPAGGTPPRTVGTLVVHANGLGLGFVRLWPTPKPIREIRLSNATYNIVVFKTPAGAPARKLRVAPTLLVNDRPAAPNSRFVQLTPEISGALGGVTNDRGEISFALFPKGCTLNLTIADDRYAQPGFTQRLKTGERVSLIGLRPAATLTGRVVRNGKPVAGVRVGAQSTNDPNTPLDIWGTATSGPDGRYVIHQLPAGVCNVALDLRVGGFEADYTAVAHERVQLQAGKTVPNVDFSLVPGALIEGRVLGTDGKPVTDIGVGVYGPAHPQSSAWVQGTQVDKEGRFRHRVPAGKQYLYAMDSRYTADAQTFTVRDGERINRDLHVLVNPESDSTVAIAAAEATEDLVRAKPPVDDSALTPAVMSFGKGAPFYGPLKLKNGATVRLAYVQDDTTNPHTLWRPDGSPPEPADVRDSLNMKGFSGRSNQPRRLFARVTVDGVDRGDYYCVIRVPHPSSWTVWQTYSDEAYKSMDLAAFHAAKTLKVTDLQFGVAAGPFTSVMSAKMGEGPLFGKLATGGPEGSTVNRKGVETSATIVFPPEYEGKDVRLDAYDSDGNKLELQSWQDESEFKKGTRVRTRSYGFSEGNGKGVARVELMVRDFEWATFRGIRLYPKRG